MFTEAGTWIDKKFIAIRDTLDAKLRPTWRVWWKLWSMRLGVAAAGVMTYLVANPGTITSTMASLPPWLANSLPTWIGPLMMAILFFARFWDQSASIAAPAVERVQPTVDATPAATVTHGAE